MKYNHLICFLDTVHIYIFCSVGFLWLWGTNLVIITFTRKAFYKVIN